MNISIKFLYALIAILFLSSNFARAQINFTEFSIDENTHGLGGIYICDLDNDLDPDVLGASLQDHQIIWFRNDGGTPLVWTKIIIGSGVGEAHSVYAADFDGDEDLDVVGAAYTGFPGIAWWRNDGGNPVSWTKFTVSNGFTNAHEVSAFDVDGDDDMDILGASSYLNRIAWWRNDGGDPIIWTEQIFSNSATNAKSVTAGDLDGDQDNDVIAVALTDHDVIWWRNEGGQPIQWTQFLIDGSFGGAHRVQAVDIDGDIDLDILGTGYLSNQIAWWRNDGGDPVNWSKQIIGGGFTNACIAYAIDLDGDDDKDVIGTGQGINQVAWWRNDGGDPIQWTKFIITNNFTRPWPLDAADLDGDLDIDIVVGSSHNGNNKINWWRNDGVTGIDNQISLPKRIKLLQNYPNPFNPSTSINYEIPEAGFVTLKVYDVLGNELVTLVDGRKSIGIYSVEFNSVSLPSGVYFYKLQTENFVEVKKMILLK